MTSGKTYLYLLDTRRIFTDEIKKKFDDPVRYVNYSFQSANELTGRLKNDREVRSCKIVIIGMHDPGEQTDFTEDLIASIKQADPRTGVILLCPPGKIDEISKNIKFNVDAYLPQNSNYILRVHNSVKKIFSEHSIIIHEKRRNRSLAILFVFIIISILTMVIASIKLPEFF